MRFAKFCRTNCFRSNLRRVAVDIDLESNVDAETQIQGIHVEQAEACTLKARVSTTYLVYKHGLSACMPPVQTPKLRSIRRVATTMVSIVDMSSPGPAKCFLI